MNSQLGRLSWLVFALQKPRRKLAAARDTWNWKILRFANKHGKTRKNKTLLRQKTCVTRPILEQQRRRFRLAKYFARQTDHRPATSKYLKQLVTVLRRSNAYPGLVISRKSDDGRCPECAASWHAGRGREPHFQWRCSPIRRSHRTTFQDELRRRPATWKSL